MPTSQFTDHIWSPMDPDEFEVIGVEFGKRASVLVSAEVAVSCLSTEVVDDMPQARLQLGPVIDGTLVSVRMGNLVAGADYGLRFEVVTSDGRHLVESGVLPCRWAT